MQSWGYIGCKIEARLCKKAEHISDIVSKSPTFYKMKIGFDSDQEEEEKVVFTKSVSRPLYATTVGKLCP